MKKPCAFNVKKNAPRLWAYPWMKFDEISYVIESDIFYVHTKINVYGGFLEVKSPPFYPKNS